jgi:hypothetical protein
MKIVGIPPSSYIITEPNFDVDCPHCGVNDRKMCPLGYEKAMCGNCHKWFRLKFAKYKIEYKVVRTRIE